MTGAHRALCDKGKTRVRLTRQYLREHQLEIILAAGILLRLIVFAFQGPFNHDPHIEVIRHIFWTHKLPPAEKYSQAFQPPLYYLLASFIMQLRPRTDKTIQFFSFLLSSGTLAIITVLIKRLVFIQPFWVKRCCLLLAALLPQFILFGNFISNDTLSYFIGAVIFLLIFNYIQKPGFFNLSMLAIAAGLGLLTKGTLLPFYPVLILLITFMHLRAGTAWKKTFLLASAFVLISLSLGSYPYVKNVLHYGRPFIHNLDFKPSWAEQQKPTYIGWQSVFDVNLPKLMQHPTISDQTRYSYPLMLYGTFWYQYIPESTLGGNRTSLKYLGSVIYLVALVPTLLFGIGFWRILASLPYFLKLPCTDEAASRRLLFEMAALLIGSLCLALVVAAGVKYDVWSCFQSRLLFPAFVSIVVVFNAGLEYIRQQHASAAVMINRAMTLLFSLFLVYFITEISLKLMK
jgi:hypothetical protein